MCVKEHCVHVLCAFLCLDSPSQDPEVHRLFQIYKNAWFPDQADEGEGEESEDEDDDPPLDPGCVPMMCKDEVEDEEEPTAD